MTLDELNQLTNSPTIDNLIIDYKEAYTAADLTAIENCFLYYTDALIDVGKITVKDSYDLYRQFVNTRLR